MESRQTKENREALALSLLLSQGVHLCNVLGLLATDNCIPQHIRKQAACIIGSWEQAAEDYCKAKNDLVIKRRPNQIRKAS